MADEENVAFAYRITGTQDGPFNRNPATGKKDQDSRYADLEAQLQCEDCRAVGASHEIGILQQIGAMEPVPHLDEPPVLCVPAVAGTI